MDRPVRTIILGDCWINCPVDDDYLETVFSNGLLVQSRPHRTVEKRKEAKDHGYGSLDEYHKHHEILHTFLSLALGLDKSPTLFRVASGIKVCTDEEMNLEEALVLAFQRYLKTDIIDSALGIFVLGTSGSVHRLKDLKQRALHLLSLVE